MITAASQQDTRSAKWFPGRLSMPGYPSARVATSGSSATRRLSGSGLGVSLWVLWEGALIQVGGDRSGEIAGVGKHDCFRLCEGQYDL